MQVALRILGVLMIACFAMAQTDPARHYFGDIPLVNQDGQTMRLYSDVLQGHVVIINSFFATCHGACPAMAGTLAAIQEKLGDRLGKDVVMVSISVDPETDTPAKLKAFAGQFKAKPGWYFLTGSKENVDGALRKLGQYVDDRSNHSNVVIIGNVRTGLWKKAFGLASPPDLMKVVESVLDDKG